nr:MAG TPA: hypothetical protein [Caudoviricetes sp.]
MLLFHLHTFPGDCERGNVLDDLRYGNAFYRFSWTVLYCRERQKIKGEATYCRR